MAIATHLLPCISMRIAASTNKIQTKKAIPPPIFISTNPSHINFLELRDLFSSSNLSCHRFPKLGEDGKVEPVDIRKLRIAVSHSTVVVSVFCKPEFSSKDRPKDESTIAQLDFGFRELFQRAVPVTESDGKLVGFGRAVSDNGLTASVYDVVVSPSLQGFGIGQMIVKRIIRVLTSKGIYDISALCSENERLFFKECGFGDDILGSTTMMYTRSEYDEFQMSTSAGRMLLSLPPSREPPYSC